MTNDEGMPKPEGRGARPVIRHSGFFRHSSSVIRHFRSRLHPLALFQNEPRHEVSDHAPKPLREQRHPRGAAAVVNLAGGDFVLGIEVQKRLVMVAEDVALGLLPPLLTAW